MRLHMASYCAAMRPADCVPASPNASSYAAASSFSSDPAATALACVPNTGPECHPRDSISAPCSAMPTRGPISKPLIAPSRKAPPFTSPSSSAHAMSDGRIKEALCRGTERMEVVELKTLNEGAVEQRRRRAGGGAAPSDDRFVSRALEARDGFDSKH